MLVENFIALSFSSNYTCSDRQIYLISMPMKKQVIRKL